MLRLPYLVLTTLFACIALGAVAQTPGAAPTQRARPAPLLKDADVPLRPTNEAARRDANNRLPDARHPALSDASGARLANLASAHQPQGYSNGSFRRGLFLPSGGRRDAKNAATGGEAGARANVGHVALPTSMRRDRLRVRSNSSYHKAMRNLPKNPKAHGPG